MGLTGDFEGLRALGDKIRSLSSGGFRQYLAQAMGEAARTELIRGFRESRDPYGVPWAPLKRRSGQPLIDTGRLRNSFSSTRSDSQGFTVSTDVDYASYHQGGTRHMVARRMIPENNDLGLWAEPIARAARAAVDYWTTI